MLLNDDTSQTFIGARDQDNEALAFEGELTAARSKDAEIAMVSLRDNIQQKATEATAQTQKIGDESFPTAGGKTPEKLPAENGEIKSTALPDAEGDLVEEIGSVDADFSSAVSEISNAVGTVVSGLPKNITAGILRAAKEGFDAVIPGGLERADAALVDLGLGDYVESMNGFMAELESGAGTGDKVVQELAQFAVPFSLYMKGLGAVSSMGTTSKALSADAITSFFNLDPHMERLSSVLSEYGIHNEFVAYLADQEGGESENRFRNVLENQVLGAAIGGSLFAMVKTFKGIMWTGKNLKRELALGATITLGSDDAESGVK